MNVVDVTREIALVANGVFPIAPLPDAAFALGGTAFRNAFAAGEAARKRRFDQPPARGKIRIALGHGPDRVEMIGQNHHRLDREGMTPPRLTNRDPQILDAFRQQGKPPLRQIDGEEEAAPGEEVAAVTGHAVQLAWLRWVSLRSTHPTIAHANFVKYLSHIALSGKSIPISGNHVKPRKQKYSAGYFCKSEL
jgi:hypothetical protein